MHGPKLFVAVRPAIRRTSTARVRRSASSGEGAQGRPLSVRAHRRAAQFVGLPATLTGQDVLLVRMSLPKVLVAKQAAWRVNSTELRAPNASR